MYGTVESEEGTMKQRILCAAMIMFAIPMCGRAQSGCVNSPENPTAVLLLVGGANVVLKVMRSSRR